MPAAVTIVRPSFSPMFRPNCVENIIQRREAWWGEVC
jgi:hypothetical protein